jgi:hypothetical protein
LRRTLPQSRRGAAGGEVAELLFWAESMDSWFFLSLTPLI